MEEKKKNAKTEPKNADETKPEKDDAEKLELYRFVHSFSEVALKSEMTRKSQILDQSRTIQTVFSIVSVALFSVVQLLLHDERLSVPGFRNEAGLIRASPSGTQYTDDALPV